MSGQTAAQQPSVPPAPTKVIGWGVAFMLLGVVLVWLLSALNVKPVVQGVGTGVDVFAILYIEAQFIERIIEPFSESEVLGQNALGNTKQINENNAAVKKAKDSIAKNADEMNSLRTSLPLLQAQKAPTSHVDDKIKTLQQDSENKSKTVDDLNKNTDAESTKRVYSFWGLTSLMGMILVYFSAGLFQTAGYTLQDFVVNGVTVLHGHAFDAIISGVIVGAGTKPLHDLIGTIQKSSKSQSS